jgi:hypothetical protein
LEKRFFKTFSAENSIFLSRFLWENFQRNFPRKKCTKNRPLVILIAKLFVCVFLFPPKLVFKFELVAAEASLADRSAVHSGTPKQLFAFFFRSVNSFSGKASNTASRRPGPDPTIVSYNASVVKIYNFTGSLVRFENNFIFIFIYKKRSSQR